MTPGERSADHPATDGIEAGQRHSSSVLLSGEQWHLSASSPCDNKRKRRTNLILSWRTRTTSSSYGRCAARFRMEPKTYVLHKKIYHTREKNTSLSFPSSLLCFSLWYQNNTCKSCRTTPNISGVERLHDHWYLGHDARIRFSLLFRCNPSVYKSKSNLQPSLCLSLSQ